MAVTKRSLMWFRRDLRIGDLPALLAAGSDNQTVVPLFVIDPGFARTGAPRRALLHGILNDLDEQIRVRFGSRLLIRCGDPVAEVPAMAAAFDASTVYVSRDYAPYGRQRDTAVGGSAGRTGPIARRRRFAICRRPWSSAKGRWNSVQGIYSVLEDLATDWCGGPGPGSWR